jgi:hypothetical protein
MREWFCGSVFARGLMVGTAEREKGKPEHGTYEIKKQYIPVQYNTASKLSITVPTSGSADFDLKSKP